MTNREILKRLKDSIYESNATMISGDEVVTYALDYHELLGLLADLETEVANEDLCRFAMKSTYGKYRVNANTFNFDSFKNEPFKLSDDDLCKIYCKNDVALTEKMLAVVRYNSITGKIQPLSQCMSPEVMFNENCTIFRWKNFKTVVKCDEEDKFDVDIGLGIALYRYYRQDADTKKQFNKLAEYMDLEQLADYALDYFCGFSKKKRNKLFNDAPVKGWIKLDK